MQNQIAKVTWKPGDVPVSTRFDDPYFSLENGLEEARYVFLNGNGLPGRFQDGFQVAELGFGTGLNFLATAADWENTGITGKLAFTSFEAFPMTQRDMRKALDTFAAERLRAQALADIWRPEGGRFELTPSISLTVIVGDARDCVAEWGGQADAWFLDGFSPAKNPELWTAELLADVAAHTVVGGTCATYTAAGAVRRGLQEAGFAVERLPGYGRKRHMTRGTRLP